VPVKTYNLIHGRIFEASVCIGIPVYCVSVPSLHRESTDSLISIAARTKLHGITMDYRHITGNLNS